MADLKVDKSEAFLREVSSSQEGLTHAAVAGVVHLGKALHEPWRDAIRDKPASDINLSKAYDLIQREGVLQEDGVTREFSNAQVTIRDDGRGITVFRNTDNQKILAGDGITGVATFNQLEHRDQANINAASEKSHALGAKEILPRLKDFIEQKGERSHDQQKQTVKTDSYRMVLEGDYVSLYRYGAEKPILSGFPQQDILIHNSLSDSDRMKMHEVPTLEEMQNGTAKATWTVNQTEWQAATPNQQSLAPDTAPEVTTAQRSEPDLAMAFMDFEPPAVTKGPDADLAMAFMDSAPQVVDYEAGPSLGVEQDHEL